MPWRDTDGRQSAGDGALLCRLRPAAFGPPRRRDARHLTAAEGEEISRGVAAGEGCRALARRLGRAPSTISCELARNAAGRYRARVADAAADRRAERPKPCKLALDDRLRAEVGRGLEQRWSPQQIAARLVVDHPDDEALRVSHETIYLTLFLQAAVRCAAS